MTESLDLEKMNIDAEALNCMAQGRRHLLIHDYNAAVQSLEEACKLYDAKYGISADECADAYLNYGSALLELHRQESGALDGLVDSKQAASDGEADEDDEELEDEECDELKDEDKASEAAAVGENGKEIEEDISVSPGPQPEQAQECTSSTSNGTTSNQQVTSSNGNGNASASNDKQTMETDVDPNQPSTSTGITDDNRAEDEEESSNIEIAFEVLSMAKAIFQRQTEYRDDAFVKLSEALQKLGEILIEWENNEAALKEFNECLEIRKRHLPDDDRLIAEAYYHIGLGHSLSLKVEEANANFQKAVDVIESRLNKLKHSYTSETEDQNREKIESEIKDLEFVLPEMKSRIEDTQDQMSTSKLASVVEEDEKLEEEKLAEKKKQILAKPISNVTHLVKRKREEPTELDSNKKLKNGSENGAHNVEMKED